MREQDESAAAVARRLTPQDVRRQMDELYAAQHGPGGTPWTRTEPPAPLVELVDTGKVAPCKAIDLGCGAGHYAVCLATRGFSMTGVDISPRAIELARENARRKGVSCDFVAADLLGDVSGVGGPFDFAYDWELLHHLFPRQRLAYARNVSRLLGPGARYLSVCFSEQDPQFGGRGKYRLTRIGTCLYFSSEQELRDLFSPFFAILELKTIHLGGDPGAHLAIYAFMEKRATWPRLLPSGRQGMKQDEQGAGAGQGPIGGGTDAQEALPSGLRGWARGSRRVDRTDLQAGVRP